MTDELQEFLRRAAQRQKGASPRPRAPAEASPMEAEIVPPEPAGSGELPPLSAPIGETAQAPLATAADALAASLHATFDHKVGTLDAAMVTPAVQPAAGPVVRPLDLVQLLTSPEGLLQAVMLREILQRPEERWNEWNAGD